MGVAISTVRSFIIGNFILAFQGHSLRLFLARSSLLYSFFICLFAQPLLSAYGWSWYSATDLDGLLAIVLVGITIFGINRATGFDFNRDSTTSQKTQLIELRQTTSSGVRGVGIIGFFLVFLWQITSLGAHGHVSSPLSVLSAAIWFTANKEFWFHLTVSVAEIFAGLAASAIVVVIYGSIMAEFYNFRKVMFAVIPLTSVTPILVLSICTEWFHQFDLLQKIVAVMALSIFPFSLNFVGLQRQPVLHRIVLGLDKALPFAFVAMLFGESMASTRGIGFFLGRTRAQSQNSAEVMAILSFLIAMFVILSWILVVLAKHTTVPHEERRLVK